MERYVITLRNLLEELKKDLPPFKVGGLLETTKSIYPSNAKRFEKNIFLEGVEITKPLAVSKKAKELFKKEGSILTDFFKDFKRGDILKIIKVIDGNAICENISIKKEYRDKYYKNQLIEITYYDIISGNVRQIKRGSKNIMEDLL